MPPPSSPHRLAVQVRFADTDMMGHVNNAAFATWAESARIAFVQAGMPGLMSIILAHLTIDFRRQVEFQDPVEVLTSVETIGRSSFTLRQQLVAAGAVAAEVRSVMVHFNYDRQQSEPIPPALRTWLEAHHDGRQV
jgi:acyl-CoA thioester hydrolase